MTKREARQWIRSFGDAEDAGPDPDDPVIAEAFEAIFGRRPTRHDYAPCGLWSHLCAAVPPPRGRGT